jgi:hypothetical protein
VAKENIEAELQELGKMKAQNLEWVKKGTCFELSVLREPEIDVYALSSQRTKHWKMRMATLRLSTSSVSVT